MNRLKMTASNNGAAAAMIPAVGHTQRATIDCERNEIHVMTVSNIFGNFLRSIFIIYRVEQSRII